MKKIITTLLVVALISGCFSFAGCSGGRENVLKIYNWGEYMDESVLGMFEDWYEANTGESITVKYTEYETNEDMFTQIYRKRKDYDLVCPSEYMLSRMAKAGLLLELSDETKTAVRETVSADVYTLLDTAFDGDYMKYTVPFVWGTMGIMYNVKTPGLSDEKVANWRVLWDEDYSRRIYMKDSVRDSYTIAMISHYEEELKSLIGRGEGGNPVYGDDYREKLESILYRMDDTEIGIAEELLKKQKKLVRAYEVDSAKDEMLGDVDGKKGLLGAFWSCDAGYIMSLYEQDANLNLRYIVPEEGSNVWVDSFVIPKYAKNVEAANLFLQFLCNYDQFNAANQHKLDSNEYDDIAFLNMDYIGSTTAVAASMEAYKEYLTWLNDAESAEELADEEGNVDEYDLASWQNLKKAPPEFFDMYMEMLFPTASTLGRCAVMRDVEEYNAALDEMWLKVRIY